MSWCSRDLQLHVIEDSSWVSGWGRCWQKWGQQQHDGFRASVSRGPLMFAEYSLCDQEWCQERWTDRSGKEVWSGSWPRALCFHVQEAFFGKDLLDKSKQSRQQGVESGLLEEGQSQVERKYPTSSFLDHSSDPLLSTSATSLPSRPAAGRMYTVQSSRTENVNVD